MIELEFLGRSADAQSVVFTDADGTRYSVLINDDLRTAVRRERATLDGAPASPAKASPRPAEIQSLLRQGRTAQEIADKFSLEIDSVRRYESPVLAEKAWFISLAQRCPIGADSSSPNLEELVINRLATRGVDPRSLNWSAQRQPGEDWEISVTFVQNAVERVATWTLQESGNSVEAIDQEAHWLTESAASGMPVSALFSTQDARADEASGEDSIAETEALLDQLKKQRGKRQPLLDALADEGEDPLEDSVETTKSMPYFSARLPRNSRSLGDADDNRQTKPLQVVNEADAKGEPQDTRPKSKESSKRVGKSEETKADEQASLLSEAPQIPPEPGKKKSRRRPVPSWDEIVFGARPE